MGSRGRADTYNTDGLLLDAVDGGAADRDRGADGGRVGGYRGLLELSRAPSPSSGLGRLDGQRLAVLLKLRRRVGAGHPRLDHVLQQGERNVSAMSLSKKSKFFLWF